ncbi:glycogen synthase GlgA [Aureimonas leprariae]|uniref:Glycogen synthase n=1 Tax=Plantimonas leprariae TaxID=2615207 RepID=A0A7V7PSU3_9HYPH|nr:glycogen synthase GlgA [Aureimonas leprariae]KAB0682588.1 glycogen synthase GlgA [Aureimonas leprariae]
MNPVVLSVASEIYPLIKTGGLADVAGALPLALEDLGLRVRSLLPAYPTVMAKLTNGSTPEPILDLPDLFGGNARVLTVRYADLDLLLLDAPHLFDRPGGPYITETGQDHADNWARFAALSKAAAEIAGGAIAGFQPDILHAHDWQAALAPVYLAFNGTKGVRSVVTIHNLAFQGAFAPDIFAKLGLPRSAWSLEGVEYYGSVGYLKGGLHAADVVTTVSPTYAEEILTPEGGMGLDGLLAGRGNRLVGIVNGIDTDAWDPATDAALPQTYSVKTLKARARNKRALEAEFGLAHNDDPVFCVISRLTWQKGMDLLAEAADEIVSSGVRLAIFGSGDRMIEGAFHAAHARHPDRIGVKIGYDEALAHRIQAGADAIIIPSRFEPCGLTQLCGLRYGCVPVVSRVGGLADTVINANYAAVQSNVATGTIFAPVTAKSLHDAVVRTRDLYRQPALWQSMQKRGMATDVSWTASAARYVELYRGLIEGEPPQ